MMKSTFLHSSVLLLLLMLNRSISLQKLTHNNIFQRIQRVPISRLFSTISSPPSFSSRDPSAKKVEKSNANDINPSIKVEGVFNSIEYYACQEKTQNLVIGQIHNFASVISHYLDISHSVVCGSADGTRVVHFIGWTCQGKKLDHAFDDFRRRADGNDGVPISMKESTHMYSTVASKPRQETETLFESLDRDTYPLISCDIYTCRDIKSHDKVCQLLQNAIDIACNSSPDLLAMHLMKSLDSLSCVIVGTWSSLYGLEQLRAIEEYINLIEDVKKLAAEGTMSDILECADPARIFYVAEVSHP